MREFSKIREDVSFQMDQLMVGPDLNENSQISNDEAALNIFQKDKEMMRLSNEADTP